MYKGYHSHFCWIPASNNRTIRICIGIPFPERFSIGFYEIFVWRILSRRFSISTTSGNTQFFNYAAKTHVINIWHSPPTATKGKRHFFFSSSSSSFWIASFTATKAITKEDQPGPWMAWDLLLLHVISSIKRSILSSQEDPSKFPYQEDWYTMPCGVTVYWRKGVQHWPLKETRESVLWK